jgi:hypothetical protein
MKATDAPTQKVNVLGLLAEHLPTEQKAATERRVALLAELEELDRYLQTLAAVAGAAGLTSPEGWSHA